MNLHPTTPTIPLGLALDPTNYPRYSTAHHIRVISAQHFNQFHSTESSILLPEQLLLPWAHQGADIPGSNPAAYFGYPKHQAAPVPNYCGLTVICADPVACPTPSRQRTASLSSFSSGSSTSSHYTAASHASSSSPAAPCARLVSSFLPHAILTPDSPARFKLPSRVSPTVNLRGFGLQAAKYASISDIVVYGRYGVDENVVDLAIRVSEAIEAIHLERRAVGQGREQPYNVYIVEDPFSTFERDFPHLVAIDSNGFQRNKLNFFEREREEMRVLTQASEIAENVWLGNTQDLPVAPLPVYHSRMTTSDSSSSLSTLDDSNPLSFAICVEAHDQAHMADEITLDRIRESLDDLEGIIGGFEDVFITEREPSSDDERTTTTQRVKVLRPAVGELVHLESSSTGGVCRGLTQQRQLIQSIVHLALFLRSQASPRVESGRLPRRVLIHCGDGYTETSLLALTYIMLVRRCSVPEAYLFLQREADRSFFVYPKDVALLERIENRLRDVLEEEALAERVLLAGAEEMKRSDSGFAEDSALSDCPPSTEEMYAPPAMSISTPTTQAWFYSPAFEGHFPSRILPFLYLGNLNHATNALMLKELGITHVVSMGESALSPPPPPSRAATASIPLNSLYNETLLGNISVLDLKSLADDGIDSISTHLSPALNFIHSAQKNNGKILVHCKVGVSRSSSIVIGYLIKYLKLDLASAYLLTRSRRLNILIQPTLPFIMTLHALEGELLLLKDSRGEEEREGEEGEEGRAGLKWSNRLGFSSFATEIATLNERFLI